MPVDVLIADDSATARAIVAKVLRISRLPVGKLRFAVDGAQALRLWRQHPTPLVVTGLNMPEMDGATLVERIREHGETPPAFVVISADSGSVDAERLRRLGVAAVLSKPLRPERLIKILNQLHWPNDEPDA